MTRRVAFPFLTIPDDLVEFGGWLIGDPGHPLHPAGDVLEAWDYERDLEVGARLKLDIDGIAEALEINRGDLRLAVLLKAGTGAGMLPKRIERLASVLVEDTGPEIELTGYLTSSTLSSRLRLVAEIVLSEPPPEVSALSPVLPGARLWSTRKDILLEDGGDSRFPIELASFSEVFAGQAHRNAPWFVNWRPGYWDADFGGSVRVYVNSDIPHVAERFVEGDPATLQAILGDVMSQMIAAALAEDDTEADLSDCPSHTVGGQVRNWLEMAFPGQSVSSVRASMEFTPGNFRAAILAAAETGEGS
mgnify:CR=1 FL=1